jgi:hypothetical protein
MLQFGGKRLLLFGLRVQVAVGPRGRGGRELLPVHRNGRETNQPKLLLLLLPPPPMPPLLLFAQLARAAALRLLGAFRATERREKHFQTL